MGPQEEAPHGGGAEVTTKQEKPMLSPLWASTLCLVSHTPSRKGAGFLTKAPPNGRGGDVIDFYSGYEERQYHNPLRGSSGVAVADPASDWTWDPLVQCAFRKKSPDDRGGGAEAHSRLGREDFVLTLQARFGVWPENDDFKICCTRTGHGTLKLWVPPWDPAGERSTPRPSAQPAAAGRTGRTRAAWPLGAKATAMATLWLRILPGTS